jgi:hypothetical protein
LRLPVPPPLRVKSVKNAPYTNGTWHNGKITEIKKDYMENLHVKKFIAFFYAER